MVYSKTNKLLFLSSFSLWEEDKPENCSKLQIRYPTKLKLVQNFFFYLYIKVLHKYLIDGLVRTRLDHY